MPHTSKLSKFLKAEHVKDGDIINFMDAGEIKDKDFKQKDGSSDIKPILELTVEVNGEKKVYSPNNTTIGILTKAWGANTEGWIGKQARITILPSPNTGREMIICKPIQA